MKPEDKYTPTGRLPTHPALQDFPIRTETAQRLRERFLEDFKEQFGPGGEFDIDYRSLELQVLAAQITEVGVPKISKAEAIGALEGFAVRGVRDAYDRGRQGLYGELVDECTEKGRAHTAGWLLERLIAEMYEDPHLNAEQLATIEGYRIRLDKLKGKS